MEWIAGRGSTRVGRWLIGMGSLQVIDVAAHRNLYKCRCTYELVDGLYLSFDLWLSYWNLKHFAAGLLVQIESAQHNNRISIGGVRDAVDE